jgi:hypothetical protein
MAMRIVAPAALLFGAAAFATSVGTPHWLHESECQSYDRRTCAYIISCTYIGIQGWRKIHPQWVPDIKPCPGIAYFKLDRPPFQWRKG